MFEYVTNTTYEEVASTLREASRVALTTHQKPDGDAMGSVLALSRALNGRADIILIGPLEKGLAGTAYDTPYTCEDTPQPGDDYARPGRPRRRRAKCSQLKGLSL